MKNVIGSQTLTDVLAGTTLTATCSDPAGVMEQEMQSLAALENA